MRWDQSKSILVKIDSRYCPQLGPNREEPTDQEIELAWEINNTRNSATSLITNKIYLWLLGQEWVY